MTTTPHQDGLPALLVEACGMLNWIGCTPEGSDELEAKAEALKVRINMALAALPLPVQGEAVPADCDVRRIMLDVVPGWDGEGVEVYAKTVADVEAALTRMDEQIENFAAQPASPERKPLSRSQIDDFANQEGDYDERHACYSLNGDPDFRYNIYNFVRKIEAAHGIAATQEPRT